MWRHDRLAVTRPGQLVGHLEKEQNVIYPCSYESPSSRRTWAKFQALLTMFGVGRQLPDSFSSTQSFPDIINGHHTAHREKPLKTVWAERHLMWITQLRIDHGDKSVRFDQTDLAGVSLHL